MDELPKLSVSTEGNLLKDPISKGNSSQRININNKDVNVKEPTVLSLDHSNNNNNCKTKDKKVNALIAYIKKKSESFSRRQTIFLCLFAFVDLLAAAVVAIQAPFYPEVASNKGASATEYGLVFGIFEFTSIFASPIFGAYIGVLGPKRVFTAGILTTGMCAMIFGLLNQIEGRSEFIGVCLLVRIMEAIGESAYLTASFTIIAIEFPGSVATTFAILETCYGVGMIVGPTTGGILYDLGGYSLPFMTMGGLLFLSAIISCFILPNKKSIRDELENPNNEATSVSVIPTKSTPPPITDLEKNPVIKEEVTSPVALITKATSPAMFNLAKIPVIALTSYGIVATATGLGFLCALLEPHLRQFELGKTSVGCVFILSGGVYAITAPIYGWVCDHIKNPKVVTLLGSVFTILGFMLIGPLPFFPVDTILWVTCIGLVLFGLGMGAVYVSGFVIYLNDAIDRGYPDDVSTYGLVSGLWTAMVSMGNFIGPTVGGLLEDNVGFRWGSLFVLAGQFILVVLLLIYFAKESKQSSKSYDMKE